MSGARLVLLVGLLALPAVTQQATLTPQLPGRNWSLGPTIRPEPPRQSDLMAIRIQTIHEDVEHLAALNAALQSDLEQLRKGVLPTTLSENLKKVEKLSKKLRQEVTPQ